MKQWKNNNLMNLASDTFYAVTIASITIFYCIIVSALIFSGPLSHYTMLGISIAMVSNIVLNLCQSFNKSNPYLIFSPQDIPAIILSVMCSNIVAKLSLEYTDSVLITCLATMVISSLSIGIVLYLSGRLHLGKIIRYIPYPVLGGFIAGTGLLVIYFSWKIITGESFSFSHLTEYFDKDFLIKWLPAVILAVIFFIILKSTKIKLAFIFTIVTAITLFFVISIFLDIPISNLMDKGLLIGPIAHDYVFVYNQFVNINNIQWWAIFKEIPNILSLAILTPLALLMSASSIEAETKSSIAYNRELRRTGIANTLSPLLGGGMIGYHDLGNTILNKQLANNPTFTSIVMLVFLIFALLFGLNYIALIPRFIIGSIILYIGIELCITWFVLSYKKLQLIDYAMVTAIALVVVIFGFIQGLLLGAIATSLIFIFKYSRMQAIKQLATGKTYHSNVERDPAENSVLISQGNKFLIIKLHGFLFFGNTDYITSVIMKDYLSNYNLIEPTSSVKKKAQTLKNAMEEAQKRNSVMIKNKLGETDHANKVEYVILDFKAVKAIDVSSGYSFYKLYCKLNRLGVKLILCDLGADVYQQLNSSLPLGKSEHCYTFTDLDHGLEFSENELLLKNDVHITTEINLIEAFTEITKSHAISTKILKHFEKVKVAKNHYIYRQGEQSADMYFLAKGHVEVQLNVSVDKKSRLRLMGPGTIIGEMGLYGQIARTANVVSTEPCVLYRLSNQTLNQILQTDPVLAHYIDLYIINKQILRLAFANEQAYHLFQ